LENVGPDGNGDRDKWYQYTHPDDPTGTGGGLFSGLGNDIKFAMAKMSYNIRNSIKEWMSESLEVLFEAAALCINTVRTFWLIVLAILGPLVFGLSVFGGLHHTLTVWIARYINVFLWLPVANIFGSIIGKIQENMIRLDINQIQTNGDTFFSSTDTGYLIFLIIGIFGYFTVPSIANHIVNAGGSNPLLFKVTNLFNSTVKATVSTASAGIGGLVNRFGDQGSAMSRPPSNSGDSNRSFSNHNNPPGSYMYNKLSGKVENQTDLKS
jgi:conjugative transposon TraJ protein